MARYGKQVKDEGYLDAYIGKPKPCFVGVNFDSKDRKVDGLNWRKCEVATFD